MAFYELIDSNTILVNWKPNDKWQAIEGLIGNLQQAGKISPAAEPQITQAVLERERKMSTGMEHGIALPHAACDVVPTMTAILGISQEGFDFESLDGHPAHIVVLLLYPNRELQAHIRMLAVIARLLGRPEIREQLVQCTTSEDVLDVLHRGESS